MRSCLPDANAGHREPAAVFVIVGFERLGVFTRYSAAVRVAELLADESGQVPKIDTWRG